MPIVTISPSCPLGTSHYPFCLRANHEPLLAYPHQSESSRQSSLNGYWQYWPADGQLIRLTIGIQIDSTLTNRHGCVKTRCYTYSVPPLRQSNRQMYTRGPCLSNKAATSALMAHVSASDLEEHHSRFLRRSCWDCLKQMFSSVAAYTQWAAEWSLLHSRTLWNDCWWVRTSCSVSMVAYI